MVVPSTLNNELINEKLAKKITSLCEPKFKAREYQRELYEEAIKRNVIIYLGTGLGKTYITVLYLNDPRIDRLITSGRKAIFLAITQDLVKQQATYINEQVRFNVKIFCSRTAHCGLHIDHWSKEVWTKELEVVDVLFLTPQILLNAISTGLLNWDQFCVIFYDECHHGSRPKGTNSGHQYYNLTQRFNNYYRLNPGKEKPRIIGLTASLVNSMPKSRLNVVELIRNLENDFQSVCKTDLGVQGQMPKMIMQTFDQPVGEAKDHIYTILGYIIKLMEKKLDIHKAEKAANKGSNINEDEKRALSFINRLKLASAGFSIKPTSFPKVLLGLQIIHDRVGLWAFSAMCDRLADAVKMHTMAGVLYKEDIKKMYSLFKDILRLIHESLADFLAIDPEYELRFIRPKAKALLSVLKSEHDRSHLKATELSNHQAKIFSCIVFIRSRLEVVSVNKWLQRHSQIDPDYSFIKADYAIGLASTMNSKYSCITKRKPSEQAAMLDRFRRGDLNVIVTTSVLEEGIDLPRCSTVILYDEPSNFRQYVQSRGRARQSVSTFILMTELNLFVKLKDKMNKFNDFEETIKEAFKNSELGESLAKNISKTGGGDQPTMISSLETNDLMKEDLFTSEDMQLQIGSSVAKTILHMYCTRLSKGTPFAGNILYERFQPTSGTHQTSLLLPSGCPCKERIMGNVKGTAALADKSAVIAAIKRLYELKEINEHAIPARASQATIEKLLIDSNICIKMDPLDIEQSGVEFLEDGERPSFLFEPKYLKDNENLMRNCQQRTYKFVRVTFKPDIAASRHEAREYFQQSAFGLILHHSVNPQFLPKTVYSHYGKMDVEYSIISDSFVLNKAQSHIDIIEYMFKLFLFGLAIPRLDKNFFISKCLVYAVPLDSSTKSRLDLFKLKKTFRIPERPVQVQKGDIVRIGRYYQTPSSQRYNQQQQTNEYYIVKNIDCEFLTPHSQVPGKSYTFLDDIQHKYCGPLPRGLSVVAPRFMNQPIVEVQPVSRALAELKPGKSSAMRVDYSTRNVYFMEQMLEYVEVEASSLMQLNNLSVILYKAYQMTVANKLELSLNEATRNSVPINEVVNPEHQLIFEATTLTTASGRKERPDYEATHANENEVSVDMLASNGEDSALTSEDLTSCEMMVTEQEKTCDDTENDAIDLDEEESDKDNGDEEVDDEEDGDTECEQQGEEDDEDLTSSSKPESPIFDKNEESKLYENMMCKGKLSLDDNDDHLEQMKFWDMREYKETNLRHIPMERRDFHNDHMDLKSYERSLNYKINFEGLWQKLDGPVMQLCDMLSKFEFNATTNDWDLDSEKEFEKRQARVDCSIKPSMKFDDFNAPFASQNDIENIHNVGLLEALTLRAAQENYSLEVVETLGDSFLKYMVSVVMYRRLDTHEGFLTSARSQLVGNKYFEYLSKKNYLGSYAIRKSFSKDALALQFGRPIQDKGNLKSYCTRLRSKDLADMFEAVIGYYLATQGQTKALMTMEWLGLNIFMDSLFESNGDSENAQQTTLRFAKFPTSFVDVQDSEMQDLYKACGRKLEYFAIDIIGYKFDDISHLIQAFTHASFINKCTRTYERLEFLGDAILDFLVTSTLYSSSQIKNSPGQLTHSRSSLVNNYVFAKLAIKYKFDIFVMYYDLDMYNQLARVRLALGDDPELKFLDMIDFDPVVKLLADLFEAVAGAIYIDSRGSLDKVWSVYYPMMYENIERELQHPTKNPISKLHELFAGNGRITFDSREERVGHEIKFKVECRIRDYKSFDGSGDSKAQAKLRAIKKAMENLPNEQQMAELNAKYKQSLPPRQQNKFRGGGSGGRGRGSIVRGALGACRGRGSFNQRQGCGSRDRQGARRMDRQRLNSTERQGN